MTHDASRKLTRTAPIVAGVAGFAAGLVLGSAAPKRPGESPPRFDAPVVLTFYPDPGGLSGSYAPHYAVVDGAGARFAPPPEEPPGVTRIVSLADGRVTLHLLPRE